MHKYAVKPRPRHAEDERNDRQHDQPSYHAEPLQHLTLAAMLPPLSPRSLKLPRRFWRTQCLGPNLCGLAHS